MKALSLINEIKRLGGMAELLTTERRGFVTGIRVTRHEVVGQLNGYDISMIGEESSFYTIRRIADREYYDPSSDYNSFGFDYFHRLKDLGCYAVQVAA